MATSFCCTELVREAENYIEQGAPCSSEKVLSILPHESLQELVSCAQSGQCSICQVLWTVIRQDCPPEIVQKYLGEWDTPGLTPSRLIVTPTGNLANFTIWVRRNSQNVSIGNFIIASDIGAVFVNGHPRARYTEFYSPHQRKKAISTTQEWLKNCKDNHARCGHSLPKHMPTRVIHIGDPSHIRLHLTHLGQDDPYVALSYMWGDAGTPSLSLLKNTPGRTLSDLQNQIQWSELTLTHQQAIQVARELGYSYIWIDALCVFQDDDDDWVVEAPLLPKTYGNADLTLLAGRSGDYRRGFLEPIADSSFQLVGRCWFGCARTRDIGITDTRGWCFQESMVSKRMIIYGEKQLSFRCRENHYFEDGHVVPIKDDFWYDLSIRDRGSYSSLLGYMQEKPVRQAGQDMFDISPPRFPTIDQEAQILARWYLLTQEFSDRYFYDPADNHAALSGMVMLFRDALNVIGLGWGTVYMAGLWNVDMVNGLLWEVDPKAPAAWPMRKEKSGALNRISRAPSWSWMSLVGHIYQAQNVGFIGSARCSPAHADGKTWGPEPNGWGPSMILHKDFPSIFRLEVRAYIRKVRISQSSVLPTLDLSPVNQSIALYGHFPESRLNPFLGSEYLQPISELKCLLEAIDDENLLSPDPSRLDTSTATVTAAAEGFFDLKDTIDNPPASGIYAMRLTTRRGLLLERVPDRGYTWAEYRRLGVFTIRNETSFFPAAYSNGKLAKWDSISGRTLEFEEDRIPKEIIVLV